jgi:hypothetical protein
MTAGDRLGGDLGSLLAAADLSAATSQYLIVKQTSATQFNITTAATDKPLGILQNRPASGQTGEIRVLSGSTSKCVAGAAVAAGVEVMSDGSGRAITATTTNEVVGLALSAAANANELIEVLIRPYHKV